MKAVNCLQDLKAQLIDTGFEIKESLGWYLITTHGQWTMSLGDVYLNGAIIHKLTDAVVLKKSAKPKKVVEEVVKVKIEPTPVVVKEKPLPKVEEVKPTPTKNLKTKSILNKYKKIAKKKDKLKKS
jgi:hypothetical protein